MPQTNTMVTEDRRTLVIGSELYEEARRAAARASGVRERSVSISEWVREAIAEKLEREQKQ